MQINFSEHKRYDDGRIEVSVQILGTTEEIVIVANHRMALNDLRWSLEKELNATNETKT